MASGYLFSFIRKQMLLGIFVYIYLIDVFPNHQFKSLKQIEKLVWSPPFFCGKFDEFSGLFVKADEVYRGSVTLSYISSASATGKSFSIV